MNFWRSWATCLLTAAAVFTAAGAPENSSDLEKAAATIETLRLENRRLQRELAQARADSARLKTLRLWLAGIADRGEWNKPADQTEHLLYLLKVYAEESEKLALKSAGVVQEIRKVLRDLPIGAAQNAQLQLHLEELEKLSRRVNFLAQAGTDDSLQNSRILAVNRELELVVISSGSIAGVFPGMFYAVKNGSGPAQRLKVVATRPYVSAAVVVNGELARLLPGMELSAVESRAAAPFRQ